MKHATAQYTIQEISATLDLPKSTLRYWEKELHQFIIPYRTAGGQRRYSMEHINLFRRVVAMRSEGLSLSKIKQCLAYESPEAKMMCQPGGASIDLLAQRIADLVKHEICSFLGDENP